MVAAHTRTLRLQTSIVVLPYYDPLVTARTVAALDRLSGGRVMLGVGAGHDKAEFAALGVDFDRRNDVTDACLDAMKAAWAGPAASAQVPHPPLLIGGNARRALRRAAEKGDAWHPFLPPDGTDIEHRLPGAIAYLHQHCDRIGRTQRPIVLASTAARIGRDFDARQVLDSHARLAERGLDGSGVAITASDPSEWSDIARRFGETVIARLA